MSQKRVAPATASNAEVLVRSLPLPPRPATCIARTFVEENRKVKVASRPRRISILSLGVLRAFAWQQVGLRSFDVTISELEIPLSNPQRITRVWRVHG